VAGSSSSLFTSSGLGGTAFSAALFLVIILSANSSAAIASASKAATFAIKTGSPDWNTWRLSE
jgi:hypothetical protein